MLFVSGYTDSELVRGWRTGTGNGFPAETLYARAACKQSPRSAASRPRPRRKTWYPDTVMAIPNVKRYKITAPDGDVATVMAVLPKDADLDAYLKDASGRFDWKAYKEARASVYKVRVGQQKQKKAK